MTQLDCPSGWNDGRGRPTVSKCYYLLSDLYRTWNDANSHCATVDPDATLTTIDNQEENDIVQSFRSGRNLWLGGRDIAVEGTFRLVNLDMC